MSQRNVPSAPPVPGAKGSPVAERPSEGSIPTLQEKAQDKEPAFAAIPTPTSAFNTAEIAEAAAQAAAKDPSGFSQMATSPNALKVGVVPGARLAGVPPLPNTLPPPTHGAPAPPPPPFPMTGGPVSGRPSPAPPPPPLPIPVPAPAPPTSIAAAPGPLVGLRAELPRDVRAAAAHVVRSRAYAFVLDQRGVPIEIGSGRFAKAYLAEERWLESKTDFRRYVVIKILQKGVTDEDRMRFQIEKELLERVQGHPNIIMLYASGESDDPEFVPPVIRDKVENDFVILERLDMSLEERLKGARARNKREDLLSYDMRERLFRVLDYMIPVASAIEFAHLVKNVCHRDIKPANVLVGLPDTALRGSTLEVRLADFNVAKLHDDEVNFQMTNLKSVPGTLFFQSPEQETNVLELLVNVVQGSPEVEFFEDFYIQIAKNDTFSLFNRGDEYTILYADRAKKRLVLDRPYREPSEINVRAKIRKSVGRPADIYSLGATFYYLASGAYSNPKTLYDAFHKFIEYETPDETNTIDGYLSHEYSIIESMRAPKQGQGATVAPADRFFTYKHYLDGNGDLIESHVMKIIAKCMIRNKPDSYCQAHDVETKGISLLVQDLIDLYAVYGFHPAAGSTQMARRGHGALAGGRFRFGLRMRRFWAGFLRLFGIRR
ncbi:MAG TPA: protein kinase [Polyangiaceae bacterium]|nr:protein kinase [Polyangiaceae bacterium]